MNESVIFIDTAGRCQLSFLVSSLVGARAEPFLSINEQAIVLGDSKHVLFGVPRSYADPLGEVVVRVLV